MKNTELYRNAIEDAKVAEIDEIFPLYELKNGENLLISWHGFPGEYPVGEFYTAGEYPQLWCVAYEELKEWFAANRDGVADWGQRFRQLLGLPESTWYTHFTAFSVFPEDVIRPAYQPDPQKQITAELLDGSGLGEYEEWFRKNENWSYREAEWPWTRLGYTFDWAEGREKGLCEFLILPGAEVKVEWTVTTAELVEILYEDVK